MKINECSTSDNHKVSLLLEVENVVIQWYDLMHSILGGQVVTLVTVNVWDVLQPRHFIADTSDVNNFRQLSHLSETTTENVSDSTWHVSTWDNTLVILDRLHLVICREHLCGCGLPVPLIQVPHDLTQNSFGTVWQMIRPIEMGDSDYFVKMQGSVLDVSEH